jgi:cytochrome c-type biogenesis protein CcmI
MLILAMILLTVGTVAFVVWPAMRRWQPSYAFSEEDTASGRLALRKEILLGNIADLDFEHAMGKLAQEDYEQLRESLKRQAAQVMEALDVLDDGTAEAESASRARPGHGCSSCGKPLPSEARFCPQCGTGVVS